MGFCILKLKITLIAALLATVILLAWWGLRSGPPQVLANTSTFAKSAPSIVASGAAERSATANELRWSDVATLTQRLGNGVERATDLAAVYDQYSGSTDGLTRNIAYRAWSACFPAFLGAEGRPVTVEQFAAAMPAAAPNTPLRLAAYRELLNRCQRFFYMSRDEIVHASQRQEDAWKKGEILAPGELAMKHFLEGRNGEALDVARRTVQSGDGYAIASLQDYMHRMIAQKMEAQQLPNSERSDLRGLAFAMAACQLGLDCSADSLTALLLCANRGQCAGSLTDRYVQTLSNAADRERAARLAEQTLAAIRANDLNTLALDKANR